MTDLSRFAQSQIDPTSRLREIFPDFVASDYPIFIAFLDAYYTWLQQSTQPVGALRTIQQSQTTEIETFANQFLAQYLPNLPSTSTLDLKQLLYWVRGLYQLRGTPLGFELFWKVLYGMTVDVLTPYDYTLKSSDGLWSTQQSLKIRPILNDATFAGRLVIGETSGATVGIETTQQTNLNGISYTELFIQPDSYIGTFQINEWIRTNDAMPTLRAQVYGVVSELDILEPGTNYSVGDSIFISQGAGQSEGVKATAEVVRTVANGIHNILIANNGQGYLLHDPLTITPTQHDVSGLIPATAYVASISPGLILLEDGSQWLLDNDQGLIEHERTDYADDAVPDVYLVGYLSVSLGDDSYGGSNVSDPLYGASNISPLSLVLSSDVTPFLVDGVRTEFGQITSIAITTAGAGYVLPPTITITSRAAATWTTVPSNSRLQFHAANLVSQDGLGGVLDCRISESGINYVVTPTTDCTASGDGTANVAASIGVITTYAGRYLNDVGRLSDRSVLQDDQINHPWAYQLRSTQSIDVVRPFIKSVLHPTGTRLQHHQILTDSTTNEFLAVEATNISIDDGNTNFTIAINLPAATHAAASEQIDDDGIVNTIAGWAYIPLTSTLSGTVAITNGSMMVLGTGTNFTGEMSMFDRITIESETKQVTFVANNTVCYVDSPYDLTANTQPCIRAFEGLDLPIGRYYRTHTDSEPDDFSF